MRRLIVTALALCGLWIALPPGAGAFPSLDSVTDQYVESLPGVNGRDSNSNDRRPGSTVVPNKEIKRLERQGAEGVAAAMLAQSSAPPIYQGVSDAGSASNQGTKAPNAGGGPTAVVPAQPGRSSETSGFSAVFSNIGGSGMGIALPILMLLAFAGALLLRIRDAGDGGGSSQ